MSDLQIALSVVGAVVIASVIAYNRIQEDRFRRRAQASFGGDHGDVLLDPLQERIEPLLSSASADAEGSVEIPTARPGRLEPIGLPTDAARGSMASEEPSPIDYPIVVSCADSLRRPVLQQLLEALDGLGRRVQVRAGMADGVWVPLANAADGVSQLRVALQLADRRGYTTWDDLTAFLGLAAQWARSIGATVEAPDPGPYLEAAKDLDQFCADVDVVVGLNLVSATGEPFAATRLHSCAEAAGFRLENGTFRLEDAGGNRLFSLENKLGEPFDLDRLENAMTSGVTLLLDVPRLEQGVKVFDRMIDAGTHLAGALGGTLVDDNDAPVTEAGLEQIRRQLRGIYAAMEARGIRAGSGVALRLFS
jgi:ZipA, C-terminal FtsZ-binding domain